MSLIGFMLAGFIAYLLSAIRPGVNINILDVVPARSAPTDTGTWFVCGTSDSGPLYPVLIQSLAQFVAVYGDRQTYSPLYDALDTFFHEGGRRCYVSRIVGPAYVVGTKNLYDIAGSTAGDVSLLASAIGPGSYSNLISVEVLAGVVSGFRIQVYYNGVIKETSGDLDTTATAVAWAQYSNYIRLSLGANSAENPRVQAAGAMAGGADDRASITNTQRAAALALFSADLGPGQVSFPGDTSATSHATIETHCAAYKRCGVLDYVDTNTKATLVAAVGADRANGRWAAAFGPWGVIPGIAQNTTRTVPYSAVQAGIIARNDVSLDANVAAAGENGQSFYCLSLSQPAFSDQDRQDLNDAGFNVAVVKYGGVRTFGYRSLTNPAIDPTWVGFGGSRLLMEIAWRGQAILDVFEFDEINLRLFAKVKGQITSMLNEFYTLGSLYGAVPGDAFLVVCDTTNNTPQTIADRQLNADVAVRISEMAEMITLNLTRVPVNRPIS